MLMTSTQTDTERYRSLSDAQVLQLAGGFGPAIIGEYLFTRAKDIRERTNNGQLGPAITDPNYAAKQSALRPARQIADETGDGGEEVEPVTGDPWQFVTLSGAKMLAQERGVSYAPRVKRDDLVEALKGAGVQPPAPPAKPATEMDITD
jgi:hypothetical protein